MTRAFAWQESKFVNGGIVKIIGEDGNLITAFEPKTTRDKLKQIIGKFAKGYEVEWCDKPWSNPGFKEAMRQYELQTGLRYDCREDLR